MVPESLHFTRDKLMEAKCIISNLQKSMLNKENESS